MPAEVIQQTREKIDASTESLSRPKWDRSSAAKEHAVAPTTQPQTVDRITWSARPEHQVFRRGYEKMETLAGILSRGARGQNIEHLKVAELLLDKDVSNMRAAIDTSLKVSLGKLGIHHSSLLAQFSMPNGEVIGPQQLDDKAVCRKIDSVYGKGVSDGMVMMNLSDILTDGIAAASYAQNLGKEIGDGYDVSYLTAHANGLKVLLDKYRKVFEAGGIIQPKRTAELKQ